MSVIQQIHSLADVLSQEDLDDWIVPKLVDHYEFKIKKLAIRAYGQMDTVEGSAMIFNAFKEEIKTPLRDAVDTFIFKKEHWRNNRDINTYLLTVINRYADRARWELNGIKKITSPVCPACKEKKNRSYLIVEDKKLRCNDCTSELDRVRDDINKFKKLNPSSSALITLMAKERYLQHFAVHTRKGYKCPDCSKFIPESCNGEYGISCPYTDCFWTGKIDNLELMAHPVGLNERKSYSLQTPLNFNSGESSKQVQDCFASDNVSPDVQLEANQTFKQELSLLKDVIEDQLKQIHRTNPPATILQKTLMYEAYKNMTEKYPNDMVAYLVHRRQSVDYPLQAKIFQEYVQLMQDSLPCTITRAGKKHDIISLMDPTISLFLGISEFEAVVDENYCIPNKTKESYIGGRQFKDYGPCFIGHILDVTNVSTGESIKKDIDNYSFVQIKMHKTTLPGTKVKVKHYRIPSHYEMGSLVYLQRSRKRLVDRIYFKQHGKKRAAGE